MRCLMRGEDVELICSEEWWDCEAVFTYCRREVPRVHEITGRRLKRKEVEREPEGGRRSRMRWKTKAGRK